MQSDHFGIWLANLHLLHNLDEQILLKKQAAIIALFGGFRCVVKRLLSHHHNLTWLKHKDLSSILYKEEPNDDDENEDEDDDLNHDESINEDNHKQCLQLISLPTNVLCYINNFLSVIDLSTVQRICSPLCIISRMTASYLSPFDMMKHWKMIPYLPQYIKWSLDNDHKQIKLKGIKGMNKIAFTYSIDVVKKTGIIPYLIKEINTEQICDQQNIEDIETMQINKQIQFEVISIIKKLSKTLPTIRCMMKNHIAQKLCIALNISLTQYATHQHSDYYSKIINNIIISIHKMVDSASKFRDIFLKCGILQIIYENHKYLTMICKHQFISLLRVLFYGKEPKWENIKNIKQILLMINEFMKFNQYPDNNDNVSLEIQTKRELIKKEHGELMVDLIWIISDISRNKDYIPYIIKNNANLDMITDVLMKEYQIYSVCKPQIYSVYKPYMLILFNIIKTEQLDDILIALYSVLDIVNTSENGPSTRNHGLVNQDLCGFLNEVLQIALDINIENDHRYPKALKCMKICSEIMYNITKDADVMNSYSLNKTKNKQMVTHCDILSNVFGKIDDDEIKVDILWIMKNLISIKKYIPDEMIIYSISILIKEQDINEINGLKRDIIRGCLLIIENIIKYDGRDINRFAVILRAGFLNINFDKLLNKDKKIKTNTLNTIQAVTNKMYKIGQISRDMIEETLPSLIKLLTYIKDWEIIENILWSVTVFVNDECWAKRIIDDDLKFVEEIFLILIKLEEDAGFERDMTIQEIIRAIFIIIRKISNHSDKFAEKILSKGFFTMNLSVYLSHYDGRIITNCLQAFKSLIKKIDYKSIKHSNLSDIDNPVLLSALLDIIYIDDTKELNRLIVSEFDDAKWISDEEQLRIELTLDILQILFDNILYDKISRFKSLSDCGYLDKLSWICRYLPRLKPKAHKLRNSVINRLKAFN